MSRNGASAKKLRQSRALARLTTMPPNQWERHCGLETDDPAKLTEHYEEYVWRKKIEAKALARSLGQ